MPTLDVYLGSQLSIKNPEVLSPKSTSALLSLLSRANPEVALNKTLGLRRPKETVLRMYQYVTYILKTGPIQSLEIDRGCWNALSTIAKGQPDLTIRTFDKRVKADLPNFSEFHGTLDKFQSDALDTVGKKTQGTLILPTGGGKTVVALSLLSRLKQRTLILVHTHKLLQQWKQRIARFLPTAKVATIPGSRNIGKALKESDIVISTVQSIIKLLAEVALYREFRAQFGCVLMDECHHAPAETFRKAINKLPAFYRFGLTATRERRDGRTFYVDSVFGDPIVELGYIDVGDRIIYPKIVPIRTELSEDYSDIYRLVRRIVDGVIVKEPVLNHVKMFTRFAEDLSRNAVILKLIRKRLTDSPKSTILVLLKRREHCKFLRDFLLGRNISSEVILGGVTTKKGQKAEELVLEQTAKGVIKVLIGTSIADEGLDIPSLDTLILGAPTSWKGVTAQRIGRVIRSCDGKEIPVVYDLVDADIPDILTSWWCRLRFYRGENFEVDYSEYVGTEILPKAS